RRSSDLVIGTIGNSWSCKHLPEYLSNSTSTYKGRLGGQSFGPYTIALTVPKEPLTKPPLTQRFFLNITLHSFVRSRVLDKPMFESSFFLFFLSSIFWSLRISGSSTATIFAMGRLVSLRHLLFSASTS